MSTPRLPFDYARSVFAATRKPQVLRFAQDDIKNEKPGTSRLPLLLFFEAFDEFEGVDGFGDEFEFEALALAFEEDL